MISPDSASVPFIESRIVLVRNQKVLLKADLGGPLPKLRSEYLTKPLAETGNDFQRISCL